MGEGDEGYSIFLDGGELVVRLNTNGGANPEDAAAASITMPGTDGWYHVAMVINQENGALASSVTGYLNGSNAGWTAGHGGVGDDSFTTPTSGIDAAERLLFGASDTGAGETNFFDSQISDIRLWSSARSATDIDADLGRTLDGDESGLIGNWQLDDGAGTTAANAVTGGPGGTLSGGPAWQDTDSFIMDMNSALEGRFSATDSEGDTLSYSVDSGASHGTAAIDSDTGAWDYAPDLDYTGTDSFSYQVSDGNGGTDTVTVSVSVIP